MAKYVILFFVTGCSFFSNLHAQSGYISLFAGSKNRSIDSGDGGLAVNATLNSPYSVAMDDSGNVFIADYEVVRKVNTSGIISTYAGNGVNGFSGDGGPATAAEFGSLGGVCTDRKGNLYISDAEGSVIRKVERKTGIIRRIAGEYLCWCWGGDGGKAINAGLNSPLGLCMDKFDNLYIADNVNNKIRKIDSTGIITTVAGIGGYQSFGGDGGPATAALLYKPWGVCTDTSGNIYITDTYNQRVRKVTASTGIISTIAGFSIGFKDIGFSGDGGLATAAEFHFPTGVAVDRSGNVYISDKQNCRIRVVDGSGIINTIAGCAVQGFSGDGGPATAAELSLPFGITLDSANNIYFADCENMRIRKINALAVGVNEVRGRTQAVSVYPNPSNGNFTVQINSPQTSIGALNATVEIYSIFGQLVYSSSLKPSEPVIRAGINLSAQPSGVYLYRVATAESNTFAAGKIIIEK